MLLLSIPRVRLDKGFGFIDDSLHMKSVMSDTLAVQPLASKGQIPFTTLIVSIGCFQGKGWVLLLLIRNYSAGPAGNE